MIIGLCSNLGCGKDTVASILQIYGFVPIGFADALKQLVGSIFPFSEETLFGPSDKRNEQHKEGGSHQYWDDVTQNVYVASKLNRLFPTHSMDAVVCTLFEALETLRKESLKDGFVTCRRVLQFLGTEFARGLDDQVWVKAAKNTIDSILSGHSYDRVRGLGPIGETPKGVVLCDLRFKNEMSEIKSWGGHPIWIDASKRITPDYTHPSEPKAEEFIPLVDYVLDNNGNLAALGAGVKGMLKLFNKIK